MTGPEFTPLWPTVLMRHRLPGAAQANPVLAGVIETLDAGRDDLTMEYLAEDFLARSHPAIGWLKSCIDRAVLDYARATGVDHEIEWSLQAWPNVNRFGDYHNLHNHPHSWLSGTFHVRMPEGPPEGGKRSDGTPNAISFFDPRPQANMLAIRGDAQVDAEHRLVPEAGDILIWPAFLHHAVHVNLSRDPRLSVSFNVVLRWRDSYLPQ